MGLEQPKFPSEGLAEPDFFGLAGGLSTAVYDPNGIARDVFINGTAGLRTIAIAADTILDTDAVLNCDTDTVGGDITLTAMPLADAKLGGNVTEYIEVHNKGLVDNVIFDPDGAETVGGFSDYTIGPQSSRVFVPGPTEWEVLS